MDTARRARHDRGGFTLIELLIVIGIISLLAVAFMPAIRDALGAGEQAETVGRQQFLKTAIDGFQREHGDYPSDDFRDVLGLGVKATADNLNPGIESLVISLCWKASGGATLQEHEDWLANTDGDANAVTIPLLERTAKMEVVDGWGTPFAYFHNRSYATAQDMMVGGDAEYGGGEKILAKAYKNPRSSGYLAPRGYQLISAGPDRTFNTDDDIVYPKLPTD